MKLDWTKVTNAVKFLAAMQLIHDCHKCGNCCVHMNGIAFNNNDSIRMAKHLGIDRNEFIRKYTIKSLNKPTDRWLNTTRKEECIFWSKNGCTQYGGRGQVCRLYPFTSPEQLTNSKTSPHPLTYDRCNGMLRTLIKVLEASTTMDPARARAILDSGLGKLCMLNLVRDLHGDEAALYTAKDLGLEEIPPVDRLRTMAWNYAVAYLVMTFTSEQRTRDIDILRNTINLGENN